MKKAAILSIVFAIVACAGIIAYAYPRMADFPYQIPPPPLPPKIAGTMQQPAPPNDGISAHAWDGNEWIPQPTAAEIAEMSKAIKNKTALPPGWHPVPASELTGIPPLPEVAPKRSEHPDRRTGLDDQAADKFQTVVVGKFHKSELLGEASANPYYVEWEWQVGEDRPSRVNFVSTGKPAELDSLVGKKITARGTIHWIDSHPGHWDLEVETYMLKEGY